MTDTNDEVKAELAKGVAALRTLRDEMRVQVHLAGLEAKQQWGVLEPRVHAAFERAAKDISKASCTAIHEVSEALKKLRTSLS